MSYTKLITTTTVASVVAASIVPVASAASYQFTDVAPKYADAVEYVYNKGIQGFSPEKFGVHENITRLDAAIMLAKVLELDVDLATNAGFTDVPADRAKYINALKESGITNGKTVTSFGSYQKITRGELAVWIQKAFQLTGNEKLSFTDVASKYTDAVSALVSNGITAGISETKFGTDQFAKRGDFAIFLYRASQITPEKNETKRYFIN